MSNRICWFILKIHGCLISDQIFLGYKAGNIFCIKKSMNLCTK